ncbi:Zn(2)-C6 fungal-type domain-containing protein [Mycena venus]|uniref:Zn(2)-C6 fungal-type domain-containing protein n=1 Tax=Mycena venus TaxID=2733690 RepID=A0A8H6WXK3_9AGAR|nr:Zn(2)-C6 fungal-type domain-containing protein [Mycena venus]
MCCLSAKYNQPAFLPHTFVLGLSFHFSHVLRWVQMDFMSRLSHFSLSPPGYHTPMTSSDERSADGGDDGVHSSTSDSFQASATPTHMYLFSPASQTVRFKRTQVKIACTNCQKSCKKCDQARPCLRCVKYKFEECRDAERKGRKKGLKRGPYKKRDRKDAESGDPSREIELDISSPPSSPSPPTTSRGTIQMGYTPGYYAQFLPHPAHEPGDPFHLAPVPAQRHAA